MKGNMRSLVAQAYRVGQRRSFSSSAPNPIDHKGGSSIVGLLYRGVSMIAGYGVASYLSGDRVAKFEENMKEIDNRAWETLSKDRQLHYLGKSES